MSDYSLLQINIKDQYELKKNHPCGSNRFEVIRTGADIKLKCLGCGHTIMIDRIQLKKSIKNIIYKN